MSVLLELVAWLSARILHHFRVHHADRVPATGPAVLVANHVTRFDRGYIRAALARRVEFLPLNPTERDLESARTALAGGRVVCVFPEGMRTLTGAMLPFRWEWQKLTEQSGRTVPLIPVFLDNLWGAAGSLGGQSDPNGWRRRVAVAFGEPLQDPAMLRLALVETGARCAILQSRLLPTPAMAFVREASRWRNVFRRACVDNATGQERILTWGRFLAGAWGLRSWLARRLGPAQHVGVWLPTTLGSALTNAALGLLGRTSVNLNYTSGPEQIAAALRQSQVDSVITVRRFTQKVPLVVPDGVRVLELEDAMRDMSKVASIVRFMACLAVPGWVLNRFVFGLHRVDPESAATILFSSGSTGEPKGVVLSHRNVAANVDGFRRGVDFVRTDRMLVSLPFFHSFGYTVSLWATLTVCMQAIFHPDPREGKAIGELCRKHRCTILLGTATFLRFYLRRAEADAFTSLRLIVCGAEKLPVPLQDEFQARFGVRPVEGYGCTELSPVVSTNLPDVTHNGILQRANMPGTVGQPIPTVAVRAVNPDTGTPLPAGEVGMLTVLGPNVMQGYLGRPDLTAKVVRDGWYWTGDMGLIEPDGFVRVTGRASRFAKIAGEMVPLERIDEELHELLGQPADRMLAVVGVPCERRGERVIVLYLAVIAPDLDALFQKLRQRGLPNLWIPDRRDCYVVGAFPLLGTGKLDLRRVTEQALAIVTVA